MYTKLRKILDITFFVLAKVSLQNRPKNGLIVWSKKELKQQTSKSWLCCCSVSSLDISLLELCPFQCFVKTLHWEQQLNRF